jgi:CRISPR type III-A-associated RAMP protein Csm5
MSTVEQKTIKLALKTIAPVSVGGDKGGQLSPYADYVSSWDGKALHYLNLRKIENAVQQAGALDEYVQAIRTTINNNRSEFDLEAFITGTLRQNVDDFIARRVPQFGIRPGQRVPISPVVKNAGNTYLPGSSIKGALRTAALYDWLVNTKEGLPYLKNAADSLGKLRKLREQWLELKKNRGDFKKIREVEFEIKKHDRAIFDESDLFGGLREGPEARFLVVRDTRPLTPDALEVQALRRIRLVAGKGKSVIPQVMEAIPAGTEMQTELAIWPAFKKQALAYWNTGDFAEIFKYLQAFSLACIENEILDLTDALDAKEKTDFEREIKKLLAFYQDLKSRAEAGETFLRLGFGKTVNDNSLMLALLNGLEKRTAWHDMRAVFHKIRRESAFYPVTRLVTEGGLPMGWVAVNEKK